MSEVMVLTGVLTQNADIQKVGDDSLVTLHLAVKGIEKDMWEAVVRFSIHNWFIVKYLRKGQCVAIRGYLVSLLSHDAELDEIELGAIEVLSGKGSIIAAEYIDNSSKEDLINDGRRSVKYKVGDKVRIRSKEWIDAQPKSEDGAIELETNDIVPRMFEYAGKTATITKINEVLCNYKLDIDDGHWSWTDEMFERIILQG